MYSSYSIIFLFMKLSRGTKFDFLNLPLLYPNLSLNQRHAHFTFQPLQAKIEFLYTAQKVRIQALLYIKIFELEEAEWLPFCSYFSPYVYSMIEKIKKWPISRKSPTRFFSNLSRRVVFNDSLRYPHTHCLDDETPISIEESESLCMILHSFAHAVSFLIVRSAILFQHPSISF
jgi:hypothetical protein